MPIVNELGAVFDGGQPNEALHPGQFRHTGNWGENAALKRASDVAGAMFDRLSATHEFRVTPGEDPYTHSAKLNRIVDEIGRGWASSWEDAKNGLKRERSRVEVELQTKANLKANPALLNATLGTFQGMTAQQRSAALDELIEEGAGPVLAILAETPGVLTGLSKTDREAIVARAYTRADANSYTLLQELDKAIVRAERASLAAINAQVQLVQGTEKFAKRTERSKQLEDQLRAGIAA